MSSMAIHHILLKSPLLAQDVLKELEHGADFATLAQEFSACPSGQNQGFAGYHHLDRLPPSLAAALAEANTASPYLGPIQTELGYHILKAQRGL